MAPIGPYCWEPPYSSLLGASLFIPVGTCCPFSTHCSGRLGFARPEHFGLYLDIHPCIWPRTPCLGHRVWEILPGRSCLGPYGPMGPGPCAYMGLGKISQARRPRQGVLGKASHSTLLLYSTLLSTRITKTQRAYSQTPAGKNK